MAKAMATTLQTEPADSGAKVLALHVAALLAKFKSFEWHSSILCAFSVLLPTQMVQVFANVIHVMNVNIALIEQVFLLWLSLCLSAAAEQID
eukprot:6188171-Pleurochrysis_carterae.AAC.4